MVGALGPLHGQVIINEAQLLINLRVNEVNKRHGDGILLQGVNQPSFTAKEKE